jgi:hypothetical protein
MNAPQPWLRPATTCRPQRRIPWTQGLEAFVESLALQLKFPQRLEAEHQQTAQGPQTAAQRPKGQRRVQLMAWTGHPLALVAAL